MKFKYRRYYLYYLGRLLAFFFCLIPLRVGLKIASLFGDAAFLVLAKYRNKAIDNLKNSFPEKTDKEIRIIAREVFRNLCKNAFELVNFPRINEKNLSDFVDIKNLDIIDQALAKGKGALVITGHFGNWELLALAIRLKGYPGAVIGRRIYFHKYDEYLNDLRRAGDVNIIYRDDSPKKILKMLKENKVIGILADQDVDSVDGVFVDFFGRKAYTPAGPAILARASGAPLIPAFIIRGNGLRHALVIEKPLELVDTGDKEKDTVTNTEMWSRTVESYIKMYPEQWVWMHERWKTRQPQ